MRFPRKFFICLVPAAVLVITSGCGSDKSVPLAPVQGKVTYRGKPLPHGQVVFTPQGTTPGPQAVGIIGSDGSFRMKTAGKDGAAIGHHLVTVHCRSEVSEEEARNMMIGKLLIPEKYTKEKETPLRFEVKEGHNEYSIVLE